MTTIKAIRATITLGDIELHVFQLPDESYRLSKGQTCDVAQLDRKRLSQLLEKNSLKAIAGKGSLLSEKCIKASIIGNNAHVDLIPIELATLIWLESGTAIGKALAIASVAESIERRADAAFGIQREEAEYNARLAQRTKNFVVRRTLTDAIRDYTIRHESSETYIKFIYSNCSEHLNKIILGAKAKQAKEFYALPAHSLLRNHIPVKALRELELVEEMASRLIDERDVEPLEAVKQACTICFTKTIGLE